MKRRGVFPGWSVSGLVCLLVLASFASGARAQSEASPAASDVDSAIGPAPDRAIGVFGAMLCGAEGYLIRTNPLIGMNPYVLAAGIGGCLLALLDVCTTE